MTKSKYILKPINSFEKRSGVRPHFDQGDVITNGVENLLVRNITSTSTEALYLCVGDNYGKNIEYKLCNSEYQLVKKGSEKIKYYISNDGGGNYLQIALSDEGYDTWFEIAYKIFQKD